MSALDDKVVILTGAAGGQGSVETEQFAAQGATVYACDLKAPDQSGERIIPVALDITSKSGWKRLLAEVLNSHGRLDGLVNNAGISLGKGVIGSSTKDFRKVLDVNVTGAFLGMKACAPVIRDSGGGAIVNIGSAVSFAGFYRAAYSASKWGLRGLTKAAALEFAEWRVRVNIIHPGLVSSPMSIVDNALYQEISRAVPSQREVSPREIADFIVFLLSDAGRSITGADLPIDGGVAATNSMLTVAKNLKLWD